MKRFTLACVACAMALGAMAHRDIYFNWNLFGKTADLGHSSWSYSGAYYEEGTTDAILNADDSFTHNGQSSVAIFHNQRNHGERSMPNLQMAALTVLCGDLASLDAPGTPHVTPSIELKDEEGNIVILTFSEPLKNDLNAQQTITSTGMKFKGISSIEEFGKVNEFAIYFDGVVGGEDQVIIRNVALGSEWEMPKVSPNRVAVSMDYSKANPEVSEKGVTYIQAEDFNEPWITGRVSHSKLSGANGYRLYNEDRNLKITAEGDGAQYGKWSKDFGHTIANRFNPGGSGLLIEDFLPSGADWARYYGEYITPGDNHITFENAVKCWGAWTEYTFDVTEDCLVDISLRVAHHRSCHDGVVGPGSKYWWEDPKNGGFVLEGGDDDTEDYFQMYAGKYQLYMDGVVQRIAYDAQPKWNKNGITFEREIIPNPEKWTNSQETVNGEKVNSTYLNCVPYPFWADGDDNTVGSGWQPYYKSDMLTVAYEKGLCSEAAYKKYAHPDYMNIPLKAGRHTIKVQTMGGITWFDEMRIEAKSTGDTPPSGIEGVNADFQGYEGTPVYFDMQGRRIDNPTSGLFLVKRGNTVTKEVIR